MGDIFSELERYPEALQCYIDAYSKQPNIESTMRILAASIDNNDFSTAQKYLSLAEKEEFDVS